jgi:hypothetical protein
VAVSEIIGAPIMPFWMGVEQQVKGPTPFQPGRLEFSLQVQVVYAIDGERAATTITQRPSPTTEVVTSTAVAITPTVETSVQNGALALAGSGLGIQIEGGNDAQLRTFIGRFLTPIFLSPYPDQITIAVGEIPTAFPVALEAPAGVEIVGGLLFSGIESHQDQLIFTAPGDGSAALAGLAAQLEAQGYTRAPQQQMGGGFQGAMPRSETYCGDDNQVVSLMAAPLAENRSDLRVLVHWYPAGAYGPCEPGPQPGMIDSYPQIMPLLVAPAGTTMLSGSSSSGSDQSTHRTELSSTLRLEELANHYEGQLEAAGWALSGSTRNASLAWSAWQVEFEGETWVGTLSLHREESAENRYSAVLQVAAVSAMGR